MIEILLNKGYIGSSGIMDHVKDEDVAFTL
jgi:hypothetical protein